MRVRAGSAMAATTDGGPTDGGPTDLGRSLGAAYRGLVCDLDGVVYRGAAAVPHAVSALTAVGRSCGLVYATNNASRPPEEVARQLTGFGLEVSPEQVVTSSQAGAAHLADLLPAAAPVLAVGGEGVRLALEEVGLRVVLPRDVTRRSDNGDPVVAGVLQGYGSEVRAADLAEASYAVAGGAVWVATNRDATLPTDRGVAPGNGVLVDAVARATGRQPVVVGKPEAPLYATSITRLGLGAADVLAVGDRLDTDILGAVAAGIDSLWVLTGVDDLASWAAAAATSRPTPTYVAPDLRALARPQPVVSRSGEWWMCGGVRLRIVGGVSVELDLERGASLTAHDSGAGDEALDRRIALLTTGVRAMCDARDTVGQGTFDAVAVAASLQSVVE